jgi:HPt (histidine-containing phosphotransfer) domain-containing protein
LRAAIDRLQIKGSTETLLSPHVLLAACEKDSALLDRLCGLFRQRLPEHLALLVEARNASDAWQLREAAHKLCGMLATFSTPAAELASALEDRAAAGELDTALTLVVQVERVARELLRQVDGLTPDRLAVLAAEGSDIAVSKLTSR